jgi:hypothetical protein
MMMMPPPLLLLLLIMDDDDDVADDADANLDTMGTYREHCCPPQVQWQPSP